MYRYACILLVFITHSLFAQVDTNKTKPLGDLTLEELLNMNVYSASKKLEAEKDAPAILSVVSIDDIRKMGAQTIIDVLKYIPCLEVSMGIDGTYAVALRGSREESNILVMVNGMQVNDFYDGKVFYDLSASFIDRIEVVRGPGSALYGNNAMIGVINIFTNDENYVRVAVGPFLNVNACANIHLEKEKYQWSLNFGYNRDNINTQLIDEDKSAQQSWSLTNGDKSFETNRWNNDVFVNSKFRAGNFSFNLFHFFREHGAYVGPTFIAAPDSKYSKQQHVASLSYAFKVGDNVIITPKLYAQMNWKNDLRQEAPDGYHSVISNDTFVDGKLVKEKYFGHSTGGEINIYVRANKHLDFMTGSVYENMQLQSYDLQRNYRITGDRYFGSFGNYDGIKFDQLGKSRMVFAYYNQLNYHKNKWNITGGLRYDDFSDFGQALNPRVGAVYEINTTMRIKGLMAKAFRAPTFRELYDNTSLGNEYGVKGNTQLQNEKITTYEIGFEYAKNNVVFRYNVYDIKNNNLIRVYDPHGGGSIGVYQNLGNTRLFGHEAELSFKIKSFLHYYINFSHFISYFEYNQDAVSKADYTFFQEQARYNQELRNTPTLKINSGLTLTHKNWLVFLGANFGNYCENNKRFYLEKVHYVKIPYYLVGNFNIRYRVSEKFRIGLVLNNIGTKYSDPDESTNIDAFGEKGLKQPGPFYMLNLAYLFK